MSDSIPYVEQQLDHRILGLNRKELRISPFVYLRTNGSNCRPIGSSTDICVGGYLHNQPKPVLGGFR